MEPICRQILRVEYGGLTKDCITQLTRHQIQALHDCTMVGNHSYLGVTTHVTDSELVFVLSTSCLWQMPELNIRSTQPEGTELKTH